MCATVFYNIYIYIYIYKIIGLPVECLWKTPFQSRTFFLLLDPNCNGSILNKHTLVQIKLVHRSTLVYEKASRIRFAQIGQSDQPNTPSTLTEWYNRSTPTCCLYSWLENACCGLVAGSYFGGKNYFRADGSPFYCELPSLIDCWQIWTINCAIYCVDNRLDLKEKWMLFAWYWMPATPGRGQSRSGTPGQILPERFHTLYLFGFIAY